MKKSVMIILAIILSSGLMAISYLNKEGISERSSVTGSNSIIKFERSLSSQLGIKKKPAFFFDMGPRFRPIKKSYIENAGSVEDFLSETEYENISSYQSVQLILIENEAQSENRIRGNGPSFSKEQRDFLQSMSHSTNFLVRADFQEIVEGTADIKSNYLTPHMTVVPEKQAEYKLGNGAFYEFLREKAKKEIDEVDYEKLFPAKLYFTVNKEGELTNFNLLKSSLHPELDSKMIELMQNLPGEWEAAENGKGEKVDQELVLSFGLVGC